ncbi:hypothetical protein [Kocuria sp.]|uniref:hypothetical protein n=1 Tax=Kocuria sp. TaxID=1871328 RepID=UPI0026E0F1B3|nr:hypothetical protein [Kocuria sp.]MDO5619567.1 hypothetical protein [Kocuria sp.]
MSRTFTIITTQEPDPVAMAWAIAEISPDYWVTVDECAQVWRVDSPDQDMPIMVIETPLFVQARDEALRLFGTHGGLDATAAQEAMAGALRQVQSEEPAESEMPETGPQPPIASTYWQDVHAVSPVPEAESAAATFAKLMAHLGVGTCIQHGPEFRHLGEEQEKLRKEWQA